MLKHKQKNKDNDSPLLSSLKFGNYKITKLILRCRPKLSTKDSSGNTALLIAVQSKQPKAVHLLTKMSKTAINTRSKDGLTPLMKASLLNELKSASYLLRKGAKINLKDAKGNTAYSFSEVKKNTKMMSLLEKHGARISKENKRRIPSNIKRKAGQWPILITSAWRGQNDILLRLLKNKKNPNITDSDGNTALMRAAERNNLKATKLLLKHSASVNKKNNKGLNALMIAASNKNTNILEHLISKKAKLNLRDKNGMSALMHSASTGGIRNFKILLKTKANINYIDKKKRSLIKIAQDGSQSSIISYMIDNNTIHLNKIKLKELLLDAADNGNIQIIKTISSKGVNLNSTDKNGNTALMMSASKGFYNTSKYLLRKKVNVNAKNNNGNTALIFAAQAGKYKVVKLLLKSKANPDVRNKNRKTAIDLARSNGYIKTANIISSSDESDSFLGVF